MRNLTLILYLRNDDTNTLGARIAWLHRNKSLPSLEGRDDVNLISDNAVLVDQTSAHRIFVQLCADLASADHPYLILPLDAESSVAVGMFSETNKTIIERYGFHFAASQRTS